MCPRSLYSWMHVSPALQRTALAAVRKQSRRRLAASPPAPLPLIPPSSGRKCKSADEFLAVVGEALRQLYGLAGGAMAIDIVQFDAASNQAILSVGKECVRSHGLPAPPTAVFTAVLLLRGSARRFGPVCHACS